MGLEYKSQSEWIYIPAPGRLDSFNFEMASSEMIELARKTSQIALDVSNAQFISIPMIQFIHSLATSLQQKGGRFALVGPTEKLKRQFGIFASLEPLTVYSVDRWEHMVNTQFEGHA